MFPPKWPGISGACSFSRRLRPTTHEYLSDASPRTISLTDPGLLARLINPSALIPLSDIAIGVAQPALIDPCCSLLQRPPK